MIKLGAISLWLGLMHTVSCGCSGEQTMGMFSVTAVALVNSSTDSAKMLAALRWMASVMRILSNTNFSRH